MKPAARRRARECAVQALYSWQLSQNDIADVEYQFLAEQDVKDVDVLYFRELLAGVATNTAYLDGLMKPYLSRLLEELGQVEKAVLRIALYELSKRSDVPYKVAINEAIELAKSFGAEDSHKFVQRNAQYCFFYLSQFFQQAGQVWLHQSVEVCGISRHPGQQLTEVQDVNVFYILFSQELVFNISDVVLGQLPGVERLDGTLTSAATSSRFHGFPLTNFRP